uniref:FecR domain-containing protein n=1 Tax=Roseihalotalea indica TaxID=2867963 RepID=A0AA49GM03_9BACT|nr:FecR domain-containing protein [Tunicatimonas sp. TK19036]
MYERYTITDFILDQDFQEWVRSPTSGSDAHWRRVVVLYPHQEENIEAGRKILSSLKFNPIPEEAIHSEKMLNTILSRIDHFEQEQNTVRHPVRSLYSRRGWLKIAASIMLVLGLASGYYRWEQEQPEVIRTAYAETKEVLLPDGSQVVLNGNSSLKYSAGWPDVPVREVWLEGEAYFKVKKLTSDIAAGQGGLKKFQVHTRGLDIEVLGTEFNVHQWQDKSQVVLTEGKVKVNVREREQEVYLKPGELLEYSPEAPRITHKMVDPTHYLHWQDRQLVFDGEPLTMVATRVQEIFGYEVVFEDPQVKAYQFRGTVPYEDPDVLIQILKRAYGIEIEKKEHMLIFKKVKAK